MAEDTHGSLSYTTAEIDTMLGYVNGSSAFGRTLWDDANAAAVMTTLGFSANAQSLVTAADYAAMRGLLDLEAGTDFYSTTAVDGLFTSHTGASDPHTGYMLESNIGFGANNYLKLAADPGTPDTTKFLRDDGTWAVPSGSGDVTGVGDCADGACLDGSSDGGSYIRIYDGDSHYGEFQVPDIAGNVTYTFPSVTASIAPLTSPVFVTPTLGVASSTSVVGSITIAGNPALAANTASPSANGIIFEGGTDDNFECLLQSSVATSDKTITLPNTTGTVYVSSGTDVSVVDGGTGRSTGTTAYALVATGTTATGAQQTLAQGTTSQILVGGGAALPAWGTNIPTAVTIGSAYIYRVGGTDVNVADGGTGASTLPMGGSCWEVAQGRSRQCQSLLTVR